LKGDIREATNLRTLTLVTTLAVDVSMHSYLNASCKKSPTNR